MKLTVAIETQPKNLDVLFDLTILLRDDDLREGLGAAIKSHLEDMLVRQGRESVAIQVVIEIHRRQCIHLSSMLRKCETARNYWFTKSKQQEKIGPKLANLYDCYHSDPDSVEKALAALVVAYNEWLD